MTKRPPCPSVPASHCTRLYSSALYCTWATTCVSPCASAAPLPPPPPPFSCRLSSAPSLKTALPRKMPDQRDGERPARAHARRRLDGTQADREWPGDQFLVWPQPGAKRAPPSRGCGGGGELTPRRWTDTKLLKFSLLGVTATYASARSARRSAIGRSVGLWNLLIAQIVRFMFSYRMVGSKRYSFHSSCIQSPN